MHRRDFFKKTSLAAVAAGLPISCQMAQKTNFSNPNLLKPRRLREGATIGLIAPASPPVGPKFDKALENITMFGFKVKPGEHLYARYGHLAGRDEERLADLHAAFADPEVDAIWCARGGYGCTRLLPHLDFDLIRRNPKPLIGYSDITALHLAIHQQTGLVTFHGPVGSSEFPEDTLQHFRAALFEGTAPYEAVAQADTEDFPKEEFRPLVITPGRVRAPLIGGNLSLLTPLIGTPFAPSYRNKLVFIEDVDEQPYSVDRMLTHLLQATDLSQALGLALGVFNGCKPKDNTPSLSLSDTLRDRLGNLGIPVMYGLPFGHAARQMTLPYGILAELDTEHRSLTLLEAAVS